MPHSMLSPCRGPASLRPPAVHALAIRVLVCALLIAPMVALGQMPGGMGGMGGGMHGPGGGASGKGERRNADDKAAPVGAASTLERTKDDTNAFADALQPTFTQQPAFERFRKALLGLAGDVDRARDGAVRVQGPAPKQLAAVSDQMRDRSTAVDDVVAAATELYPLLDDRQKALADRQMITLLAGAMERSSPGRIEGGPTGRPAPPN